jgi:hypothetical protein
MNYDFVNNSDLSIKKINSNFSLNRFNTFGDLFAPVNESHDYDPGFNIEEGVNNSNINNNTNTNSNINNKYNDNTNTHTMNSNTKLIARIKEILSTLHKAKEINKINQINYINHFSRLSEKQNLIELSLEKIKRVTKSKPKKHVKYLRYIPLNKVYYYSPKKTHLYYTLIDTVVNSRKKINDRDTSEIESSSYTIGRSTGGKSLNVTTKKDLNRFYFTREEDEVLKNLLLHSYGNYVDWYKIAVEFNNFLNMIHPEGDSIIVRKITPIQCYVRYLETSNFYVYKKWTSNEDSILKKAILYYGPKNWQQISYCLDGRNNSQCFHRWMKGINPKIRRDKWSNEEDLTLGIALTKIYGFKKWSKIANHLPGRTDIQCRERWCNILDPSLEEVEWTHEEDLKLLNLNEKYGNKWSKIAKEFGNRTDNTCWRRWKYLSNVNTHFNISNHNQGITLTENNNNNNNTMTIIVDTEDNINKNDLTLGPTIANKNKKKRIFKVKKD